MFETVLGPRCGSLRTVVQLQGEPLGRRVIVYKADCDRGSFQISVVGTKSYVKSWTGVLHD
jgi:hypothetical protein